MLTKTDFTMMMEKLSKCFPRTNYTKEKWERIYSKLEHLNKIDAQKVFDHIIDISRFAPIPDDFEKAIRAVGIDSSASRNGQDDGKSCKGCGGSGMLTASKKVYLKDSEGQENESLYDWVDTTGFRCKCNAGKSINNQIARWSDKYKEMGFIVHLV